MFKQDKIKAIYEKIADKTLSFGCKILNNIWNEKIIVWEWTQPKMNWYPFVLWDWKKRMEMRVILHTTFQKVIWHPVMIWDVIDFLDKEIINKFINISQKPISIVTDIRYEKISILWRYKRKTIEEQSEECIDYVYNLIFEKW